MPISSALKTGSKGPAVLESQTQLLALGYVLPRFGAVGDLGDETLAAYGAFLMEAGLRTLSDELPNSVTVVGFVALDQAFQAQKQHAQPAKILNEEAHHPHAGRSTSMPFRPWRRVTAIVLHQTATKIGEKASSWHTVPIHFRGHARRQDLPAPCADRGLQPCQRDRTQPRQRGHRDRWLVLRHRRPTRDTMAARRLGTKAQAHGLADGAGGCGQDGGGMGHHDRGCQRRDGHADPSAPAVQQGPPVRSRLLDLATPGHVGQGGVRVSTMVARTSRWTTD